ncbi:MAG: RrF2 family transcriptional regulator [Planctomycetota bacterium]|jgi:Rrf2 family protein
MYGKQTECAIAAMSRLAEVYDGGKTLLSATEIAESRGLPRPFVAKTLSILAQAGFVNASRGPGGGCTLAKNPKKIKLNDIYMLFEREDGSDACPFGGGRCGVGDACPMHHKLVAVQEAMNQLLHQTTFDAFRVAYQKQGLRPTQRSRRKTLRKKRETYRARPSSSAAR